MLRTLLFVIFASSSHLQCGDRQAQRTDRAVNQPQQQTKTNQQVTENQCDFSSFKALKMNSLPTEHMVKPAYPAEAKEKKISGTVRVKVIVDEKGNVVKACVIEGDESLRKAAETAALGSKFTPGLWNSYLAKRYDYAEFVIAFNFVL